MDERTRENEVLRKRLSRLSEASLRIDESLGKHRIYRPFVHE